METINADGFIAYEYNMETVIHTCDECGDEKRAVGYPPNGPGDWSYVLECGHVVFGWVSNV